MPAEFWFRYGAAVATVCVTLWILARIARRLRTRNLRERGDALQEIASIALAPNVSVYIVRALDRDFLVTVGASMCAVEIRSQLADAGERVASAADPKRY